MYIRVQQATLPSDREEVYRFRYRVRVAELGRAPEEADHSRGWIRDPQDEHARIMVAVDESTGAVLGTLRAHFGCDRPFPALLSNQLDLSSMSVAFGDERLCHSGAFLVDPAYRGQTVASQLLAGLVRAMLAAGVEIDVCLVDPSQARSWFQLGYRPYGPIAPSPDGGELRLPLALVLRDRPYLNQVGSPLHGLLGPIDPNPAIAERLRALYPHFEDQRVTPQRLGEFWASVAHATGSVRGASIFEGLEQARLDALLRDLPSIRVSADRPLPPDAELEGGLGLLLRGRIGLTMEEGERPFFVSVLKPGEVFGSLEGIPTTPPSARLVALEDTELLVLSADRVESIGREWPEGMRQLRQRLGEILADRLDATNRQVAGFMRGSPERVPVHLTQGEQQPPGPREGEELGALETELLREAGLPEDGTLLELGSGDGSVTMLLAHGYPRARIVGVERDPERCARAERRAAEAGLDDHCTFLVGTPERIPLEARTVDGAYARLLMQRLDDPLPALAQLRRVLRPGAPLLLLDVDDGGLMIHPEPPGTQALLARVAQARARMGGDRRVGRKLSDLLQRAGFTGCGARALAISPEQLPFASLVALVFGHQAELLGRDGGMSPEEARCLRALRALHEQPGAWLCAPVVLAWGYAP